VKSAARSVLTTDKRLGAGPAIRTGSQAAYRAVAELPGEPHVVRDELVAAPTQEIAPQSAAIACIVHVTDLHVTDAQSPARFEYINRYWQDPRFRELLTMQRPQELLNAHAIAAMARAVNNVEGGPLTGAAPMLVAMTGDAVDNTQRNELTNFLALFDGGTVRPDSGAPGYAGVQLPEWPGEIYWKPDGAPDADIFQSALGFPRDPGFLERATAAFESEGLKVRWLGCYGNHEKVCQGVGIVTAALEAAMTGFRKPAGPPAGLDPDRAVEDFIDHPETFMEGETIEVQADPDRRPISRGEFIDAHVRSGEHGFTTANVDAGQAYYVHDAGLLRFITLDTVCDAGGADGTIDLAQLRWLERSLEEVHSSFRSRDGTLVQTGNADRYVVLMSHHGHDSLSNPRGEQRADALLELLLRFDTVVLWLNGHTHFNRIVARKDAGRGQGFWEVTTGSMVDWPCQARLVEIFKTGDGQLAIGCTMLDHDGEGLAGLHRELAANAPYGGFDSSRAGTPADRNALLLLPSPF
jgi:metallophosphoesterase (TIGR03767 family)